MTAFLKQFCKQEGSLDGHDTVPEGQGQRVLTFAPHLVDDGPYLQLRAHSINESGCALYYLLMNRVPHRPCLARPVLQLKGNVTATDGGIAALH